MRLAWLTDLHLDFVGPAQISALVDEIHASAPDAVLIGGDTGEAPTFARYLHELARYLAVPIYFVLGNHDYYRSSITSVRESARALTRADAGLIWLPAAGVVPLTESTSLIGHDGWADARFGDFLHSDVVLNDYRLIAELRQVTVDPTRKEDAERNERGLLPLALQAKLQELGDEAASHFESVLPHALEQSEHVIVLMHVPPFREACWHEGRISDDIWLPHFSCKAAGDVLRRFMENAPDRRLTVFCGHTHGAGTAQILPNLVVITGGAEYGKPALQRVIQVPA
jgi:3',5'-cyclic-AMP phosphodiesterase